MIASISSSVSSRPGCTATSTLFLPRPPVEKRMILYRATLFPASSTAVMIAFARRVPLTGNRSDRPAGNETLALALRSKFMPLVYKIGVPVLSTSFLDCA